MAFPRRRREHGDPLRQALWKKHLPLTIAKSWNEQTGDRIWKVHLYQTPRRRIETGCKLNIPLGMLDFGFPHYARRFRGYAHLYLGGVYI